jgi:phage terminase small subunit
MPRRPVSEIAPRWALAQRKAGDKRWAVMWDQKLKVLKDQGTWSPDLREFLEDYLWYRRQADAHRGEAALDPFFTNEHGRTFAHPGFAMAREDEREARALADLLVLTPEARRRHGLDDAQDPDEHGDQAGL